MSNRNMSRAVGIGLLICGVAVGTAAAQKQERGTRSTDDAPKNAIVSAVGCFQHDTNKHHDRFVLAKPMLGTATSVTNGSCGDAVDVEAFDIREMKESGLKEAMPVGQIVEVTGRLGRIRDGDDLREIHATSFRVVPVVPPPVARVEPRPAPPMIEPSPAPEAAPTPEPEPVATTGVFIEEQKPLPHSASPLASVALLGFALFAAAFVMRLFDRARAMGRV